jgi:hypothetical protein
MTKKVKLETQVEELHTDTVSASSSDIQNVTSVAASKMVNGKIIGATTLFIVAVLGVFVATAFSLGRNTPLSHLATVLPVEQIPGLNSFTKSSEEMVRDGLGSFQMLVKQPSREYFNSTNLELDAMIQTAAPVGVGLGYDAPQSGMPISVRAKSEVVMAFNADPSQTKTSFKFGGNFKSGIFNIDLGEEGVSGETISPNRSVWYMKFQLSPQLLQTIQPVIASANQTRLQAYEAVKESQELQAEYAQMLKEAGYEDDSLFGSSLDESFQEEPVPFVIEDYIGKYLKFDYAAMQKKVAEKQSDEEALGQPRSMDEIFAAYEKLMEKLEKDLLDAANNAGLLPLENYLTITSRERASVNGQQAVVLKGTINQEEFAKRLHAFSKKLPDVLIAHQADFVTYCKETAMTKTTEDECEESFKPEVFEELKTAVNEEDTAKEFERVFMTFVKSVEIKDFEIAVSPVDNVLLRVKYTASLSSDGMEALNTFFCEEISASDECEADVAPFELTKLNMTYLFEEKSRGVQFDVSEPEGAIDLVEKLYP